MDDVPAVVVSSLAFRVWSTLVALARPREIRTLKNQRCKLPLWPLTFLNYTKMTKYEALEKNAVSEPKMPKLGDLQYSRNSRKAHFIGRFSTYSLMEKLGGRYEWRREWDSNPRYSFPHTRFPSVRLKPLGHLSGWYCLEAR